LEIVVQQETPDCRTPLANRSLGYTDAKRKPIRRMLGICTMECGASWIGFKAGGLAISRRGFPGALGIECCAGGRITGRTKLLLSQGFITPPMRNTEGYHKAIETPSLSVARFGRSLTLPVGDADGQPVCRHDAQRDRNLPSTALLGLRHPRSSKPISPTTPLFAPQGVNGYRRALIPPRVPEGKQAANGPLVLGRGSTTAARRHAFTAAGTPILAQSTRPAR
jgi:hypothetical protein